VPASPAGDRGERDPNRTRAEIDEVKMHWRRNPHFDGPSCAISSDCRRAVAVDLVPLRAQRIHESSADRASNWLGPPCYTPKKSRADYGRRVGQTAGERVVGCHILPTLHVRDQSEGQERCAAPMASRTRAKPAKRK